MFALPLVYNPACDVPVTPYMKKMFYSHIESEVHDLLLVENFR